jgi:hypothetical protein
LTLLSAIINQEQFLDEYILPHQSICHELFSERIRLTPSAQAT